MWHIVPPLRPLETRAKHLASFSLREYSRTRNYVSGCGYGITKLYLGYTAKSSQVKKLFIAKMVTATNLLVLCYDKDNTP